MNKLKESLLSAPVVEIEGYQYVVHPITDGVPSLDPSLLRDIVVEIIQMTDLDSVDKIVTPAAMGIHITTALSLVTDIPFVVVRKRQYGLPGEVSLSQETGYSESEMFINDVQEDNRVLILDDLISTGGTITAICQAIESIGADIVDVITVIQKNKENATEDLSINVKTLVTIDIIDGEVVIID